MQCTQKPLWHWPWDFKMLGTEIELDSAGASLQGHSDIFWNWMWVCVCVCVCVRVCVWCMWYVCVVLLYDWCMWYVCGVCVCLMCVVYVYGSVCVVFVCVWCVGVCVNWCVWYMSMVVCVWWVCGVCVYVWTCMCACMHVHRLTWVLVAYAFATFCTFCQLFFSSCNYGWFYWLTENSTTMFSTMSVCQICTCTIIF